jgi:orotate phosphoribosyltransferase
MMPVYNDNRRLMADPAGRTAVRRGLAHLVSRNGLTADAIAGTASAGIAPATLLAEELALPLYYVRSSSKEHGRQRLIEGAPDRISGQRIILVEDLISTGGSSAAAAEALIEAGAEVVACLAIFSYGFAAAEERFGNLPGSPPVYPLATVTQLTDVLNPGAGRGGRERPRGYRRGTRLRRRPAPSDRRRSHPPPRLDGGSLRVVRAGRGTGHAGRRDTA